MKKPNLKNNKGITLIALIITIVVLFILAIVAIGAAQDSNIVGYAQNAAGKYEEGKGLENNTIAGYEYILNQYSSGGNSIGNNGGSNTSEENLGKYVRYDVDGDGVIEDDAYESILWRVLRNDENKVELITANVIGTGVDGDGIEPVNFGVTDFNDARNKYNGAISTIVQKCIDVTGITSVRSIGGPATDTVTTTFDFKELARTTDYFNPQVDMSEFDKYEGENGFKIGDNNYLEDYNQMVKAGVVQADNSQDYWLASRYIETGNNVHFNVRHNWHRDGFCSSCNLCRVGDDLTEGYERLCK